MDPCQDINFFRDYLLSKWTLLYHDVLTQRSISVKGVRIGQMKTGRVKLPLKSYLIIRLSLMRLVPNWRRH